MNCLKSQCLEMKGICACTVSPTVATDFPPPKRIHLRKKMPKLKEYVPSVVSATVAG